MVPCIASFEEAVELFAHLERERLTACRKRSLGRSRHSGPRCRRRRRCEPSRSGGPLRGQRAASPSAAGGRWGREAGRRPAQPARRRSPVGLVEAQAALIPTCWRRHWTPPWWNCARRAGISRPRLQLRSSSGRCSTPAGRRSPRGARPLGPRNVVLAQVSSIKTTARWRARSFFARDPVTGEQARACRDWPPTYARSPDLMLIGEIN